MDSADQTQQILVYADGYSYTEFFHTPAQPEAPTTDRRISVFHAFFAPECPSVLAAGEPSAGLSQMAKGVAGKIG
ncbi:hypothetical protein [Stutzerimonas zhaodongensis]|uniref:hypothetical protein n=1 Tax=Stutzerimonas TaxID=2901164 RepID=UPI00388F7D3F